MDLPALTPAPQRTPSALAALLSESSGREGSHYLADHTASIGLEALTRNGPAGTQRSLEHWLRLSRTLSGPAGHHPSRSFQPRRPAQAEREMLSKGIGAEAGSLDYLLRRKDHRSEMEHGLAHKPFKDRPRTRCKRILASLGGGSFNVYGSEGPPSPPSSPELVPASPAPATPHNSRRDQSQGAAWLSPEQFPGEAAPRPSQVVTPDSELHRRHADRDAQAEARRRARRDLRHPAPHRGASHASFDQADQVRPDVDGDGRHLVSRPPPEGEEWDLTDLWGGGRSTRRALDSDVGRPQGTARDDANPQADTCCVCCEDLLAERDRANDTFALDCCGQVIHLECAASLMAHGTRSCPTCRRGFPDLRRQSPFRNLCNQRGISLERPSGQTNPEAVPPSRTDSRPAAPTSLIPRCCNRVCIADPGPPARFADLPDRSMTWAPNLRQATGEWEAEWMCNTCNQAVSMDSPGLADLPEAPVCARHGPRTLVYDLQDGSRTWVCALPSPIQFEVPVAVGCSLAPETCQARTPAELRPPHTDLAGNALREAFTRGGVLATGGRWQQQQGVVQSTEPPLERLAGPFQRQWQNAGPPSNTGHQNSWLYVPLLLSAAGLLQQSTREAWCRHPSTSRWWEAAEATLITGGPVDLQELTAAAERSLAAMRARSPGHPHRPANENALWQLSVYCRAQPRLRSASLAWVISAAWDADGYVPSIFQETLLAQLSGNMGFCRQVLEWAQQFREYTQRIPEPARLGLILGPEQPSAPAGPGGSAGEDNRLGVHAAATQQGESAQPQPRPAPPSLLLGEGSRDGLACTAFEASRAAWPQAQGETTAGPASRRDTLDGCQEGSGPPQGEEPQHALGQHSRRLILTGIPADNEEAFAELFNHGSEGGSDAEGAMEVDCLPADVHPAGRPDAEPSRQSDNARRLPARAHRGRPLHQAFGQLDQVDLASVFRRRAATLQGVPAVMRGPVRNAFRIALEELHAAQTQGQNSAEEIRAWKLFLLVSRLLLFRAPGQKHIPKEDLLRRASKFQEGKWLDLLSEANVAAGTTRPSSSPATLSAEQGLDRRAARANALVHLGEVSAARQALVSDALAPGDATTLRELTDPARRPQQPHEAIEPEALQYQPREPIALNRNRLVTNLRGARRGAAPGPSGTTGEHLKIILDDELCTELFCTAVEKLSRGALPQEIAQAMRLGRLVALRKANGKVRGIVTGDLVRRLAARTLAQQLAPAFEDACSPFQYALSTRAGTECVAHALRAATQLDPRATVLSIDGVGAFDHVARRSMLGNLMRQREASAALPFVRLFYGQPSEYLWYDDAGTAHTIKQAEGGEQGDPLMPALFALGQHPALEAVQGTLRVGEAIFAFLDDIYIISPPERVRTLFDATAAALWQHAKIQVNLGKTRVWNMGGEEPPRCRELGSEDSPCWVGDPALPASSQGLQILGAPLGSSQYIEARLEETRQDHNILLDRIPAVPDLQAAWLILLLCASPRSNSLLRMLPPSATAAFARQHDDAILSCLGNLLDQEVQGLHARRALLPFAKGGLGFRSAARLAPAAYWASWADSLAMTRQRHPQTADRMVQELERGGEGLAPCLREAAAAAESLRDAGFDNCPTWQAVSNGARPEQDADGDREHAFEPGGQSRGWQSQAAEHEDAKEHRQLLASLDPASRALLLSQAGPMAARALTVLPTAPETKLEAHLFRVVLLRRLRMPLPYSACRCRCRRVLDPLGDHRSACGNAGVLGPRGFPLEKAAARVCREAGARVATNVFVRDLNLDGCPQDNRRLEVVANGLPLWQGAQIAVDTTLVSPIRRDGQPRPNAARVPGAALSNARRRKETTYPEFGLARRCRLTVLAAEVGGRWNEETVVFLRLLARAKAERVPEGLRQATARAYTMRWSGLLAASAQRSFAASLLELPLGGMACVEGQAPDLSDVLGEVRWSGPTEPSRLPVRG